MARADTHQTMLPHFPSSALALAAYGANFDSYACMDYARICASIAAEITPASMVYYPGTSPTEGFDGGLSADSAAARRTGSPRYEADMKYWNPNSGQPAACAIEPATAADVGTIVSLLLHVWDYGQGIDDNCLVPGLAENCRLVADPFRGAYQCSTSRGSC